MDRARFCGASSFLRGASYPRFISLRLVSLSIERTCPTLRAATSGRLCPIRNIVTRIDSWFQSLEARSSTCMIQRADGNSAVPIMA